VAFAAQEAELGQGGHVQIIAVDYAFGGFFTSIEGYGVMAIWPAAVMTVVKVSNVFKVACGEVGSVA
jgi:hypothetical protein